MSVKTSLPPIRRIVTGYDENGQSTIVSDGVPPVQRVANELITTTHLWATDQTPANFMGKDDGACLVTGTAPPINGSRFLVLDIAPGELQGGDHQTDTLDYAVCLFGEVDAVLDAETCTMKAGDILIQRGTMHNWINRSQAPARLLFAMLDGTPKRSDSLGSGDKTG
ncbi:MAG: cupin domain-containing protein [Marinosulfonomonas sp.]|nr:cupin domain-containing protein [Marinosulfonomonas sp.]